jgi:hypothetical protein
MNFATTLEVADQAIAILSCPVRPLFDAMDEPGMA